MRWPVVFLFVLLPGVSGATAVGGVTATAPTVFEFSGQVLVSPWLRSGVISIVVESGNAPAERRLLGASQNQTFSFGPQTLVRTPHRTRPITAAIDDVQEGDFVKIRVRAPASADLPAIESRAAQSVTRLSTPVDSELYAFGGPVRAFNRTTIVMHVTSGNWSALQAMLGHPLNQAFHYGPSTVFIHGKNGTPTVVSRSDLNVLDYAWVRVRAPRLARLQDLTRLPLSEIQD